MAPPLGEGLSRTGHQSHDDAVVVVIVVAIAFAIAVAVAFVIAVFVAIASAHCVMFLPS